MGKQEIKYGMVINIPTSNRYEAITKSIDFLKTIKGKLQTEDVDMYIKQESGKSSVALVCYQGFIDSLEEYNKSVEESRKNPAAPRILTPQIELEEMTEEIDDKEKVDRDEVYTYILMAEGNLEDKFDKISSMC